MDIYEVQNAITQGKSIYDLPLRVTYYARVSTDSDEQLHSLQNQIEYFTDLIDNNPNWTLIKGYVDEAESATSTKRREQFLTMINDGVSGKFDFIITKELSRFSRNTLDSITYTQKLLEAGVGVLFQQDNINTLMPDSELRLTIMSSFAQDEVRKISERVSFGLKRSINKGVVLGNNNIMGYVKDNGKLVVVEEEAELVRMIFEMYAIQKMGMRRIRDWLFDNGYTNTKGKRFGTSTIERIITNPKYKGYYCGGKSRKLDYKRSKVKRIDKSEWVTYKDEEKCPPIVSEQIWNKANAILEERSEKVRSDDRTSYQKRYTYSGKIICGEHNVPYYRSRYQYKTGIKEVWQCREYSHRGIKGCSTPKIFTIEIDEVVKEAYNAIIKDKADIINDLVEMYSSISSSSTIRENIKRLEENIEKNDRRKDELLDLKLDGHITANEFKKRNDKLNLDIEDIRVQITELEEEEKKSQNIADVVETFKKVLTDELDYEKGFNISIVENLLDKIEIYKTDNKQIVRLKVYFKVFNDNDGMGYEITRQGRGKGFKAHVCTLSHI